MLLVFYIKSRKLSYKATAGNDDEVAEIEALIKLRNDSRAAKDWANAIWHVIS